MTALAHLCLGTASWDTTQAYNNRVAPTDDEIKRIFDTAESFGIKWLDTAAAYGNCEERLWSLSAHERFRIVTKVRDSIVESGFVGSADVILIHDKPMTVVGRHDYPMLHAINDHLSLAGFSVYTVEQAEAALDLRSTQAIQAPWATLLSCEPSGDLQFAWQQSRDRAYAQGVLFFGRQPFARGLSINPAALHWALRTNPRGWCVVGVESAEQLVQLYKWREEAQ